MSHARDLDRAHMAASLALARRRLGASGANPPVGCVIARGARVLARAATAPGGRPHAETQALAAAGAGADGASAYVTLEPCAHRGATPSCADALIEARIARVVAAMCDPDPRTDGAGLARLRAAGGAVEAGLLEAQAQDLLKGFVSRIRRGRPWVTLKLATSLDGRVALASGASKWITGEAARARVHLMRAEADAILTGLGTVRADDPALTCRLAGLEGRSPIRVVIDPRAETPATSRLAGAARETPLWLLTRDDAPPAAQARLLAAGARLLPVGSEGAAHIDLAAALARLGDEGVNTALVEAGPGLASALLGADLVDEIAWFHAPLALGADALPALGPLALARLAAAPRFAPRATERLGPDALTWARWDR